MPTDRFKQTRERNAMRKPPVWEREGWQGGFVRTFRTSMSPMLHQLVCELCGEKIERGTYADLYVSKDGVKSYRHQMQALERIERDKGGDDITRARRARNAERRAQRGR